MLPVENRAQLIDDAFNLARSGEIDQVTALELTAYLDAEIEYLPWEATLTVMAYIRDMFSRYPGYGPLEVGYVFSVGVELTSVTEIIIIIKNK